MTSIRSFSEILLGDTPVSPEERGRFIAIIHDESLRLTRLLDEILDVSRLEGGSADLPLGSVDAARVIRAALDTVSGDLRKHGVAVELDPIPDEHVVHANEDRMRQALINLLSNAIKYNTAAAPGIRVRCERDGSWLTIDVIDNGGGIARHEASAVFEKFNRGVRSDRGSGSGLGLTISRAVMRSMGGDLTVEFAPDDTSFFRMRLALAAPAESVPELQQAQGA
jgi:signal transduction histidine kinase